jgi:two-component system LytT family response regulator/two-component system response regulator LytT
MIVSNQPLSIYLVDDEEPALKKLQMQLQQIEGINLLGMNTNGLEAVAAIKELLPDLVLLDINMPLLDGFDLLAQFPERVGVIFTTAHTDYAVRAFEKSAIDYLVKPFDTGRLLQAIEKARQAKFNSTVRTEKSGLDSHIVSKQGDKIILLKQADILCFQALANGVYAKTMHGIFPVSRSMSQLEASLDPTEFIRVHRSYIVQLQHVHEIQRWFGSKLIVFLNDAAKTEIYTSREGAAKLKHLLCF